MHINNNPLLRKHKSYYVSRRLNILSKPRVQRVKYQPKSWSQNFTKIQIFRSYESGISRRLDQLATPPVRQLISTREKYRKIAPAEVIEKLDKQIEKSVNTVYSKLAHVNIFEEKIPKSWTKKEWQKHNEWLVLQARPKKIIKEERKKWPSKKIDPSRLIKLSTPRLIDKPRPPLFFNQPFMPVSESAKHYQITDRMLELSTPKRIRKKYNPFDTEDLGPMIEIPRDDVSYEVPKEYAKIQSTGLEKLAQANALKARGKFVKGENVTVVAAVSPNALKAKATKHTMDLAEPKTDYKEPDKPNPFSVNPKALKKVNARLRKKMEELSKPRSLKQ